MRADDRGRSRIGPGGRGGGVPLQVAYWRRFVPGLRRLHDRIAAGELGTIHLVTCYQWDEQPGFLQGAAVQAVCDAMETSAASGRWVRVSEVTSGGNL